MAVIAPTNFVAGGGDVAGIMEDISKMAPHLIDPSDAPFYTRSRKERVRGPLHEWLTDALLAITATPTPLLFSANPTYSSATGRARVGNRIQRFIVTYVVAEYEELIAKLGGIAGVGSELRREVEINMRELMKTLELTLLSEQIAVTDNATVGAELQGFFSAVTTGVTDLAASALTTVTEANLNTKLLEQFERGASRKISAYLPPIVKQTFALAFVGKANSRQWYQAEDATMKTAIDVYESPVGMRVEFIPDRSLVTDQGIALVDHEQMAIGEAMPITVKDGTNDADTNLQGRISTYLTLVYGNQRAHAGWKHNSTPA